MIDFAHLLRQGDLHTVAQRLIQLEIGRGVLDASAFRDNPFVALDSHPEVTVEFDDHPPAGCSVFGFYRPNPPTIILHPSVSDRRDNFTVLHEYGHHVQRQHLDWLPVWMALPDAEGRVVNEEVSDAFAAEILLPAGAVTFGTDQLSARHIRDAFESSQASRQATVMRAADLAKPGERAVIVLATLDGTVMFARSPSNDVMPRRGAVQPDLARLIAEAAAGDGFARGRFADGLQTASGWAQHELEAEVAVDHTGRYGFAVITRESRYGTDRWDKAEFDCPNAACSETFILDASVQRCGYCKDPRCPACNACSCERTASPTCPECFSEFSVAERDGLIPHECP